MVFTVFLFVLENCCLNLNFELVQILFGTLGALSFYLGWKIRDWGRYNFELVQMFLKNQIGDCFVMHVLCSLCVFFRDGKFLVEALPGGMLRFCNYS